MDIQREDFARLISSAAAEYSAGRTHEAVEAYRAALKIQPQHAGVLHNLGVLVARHGDRRAALQYFDAALGVDPRYASAHFHRAAVLEELGERDEAIAGYARAVALEPSHYASHRALAFCLLAKSQRGRALDHFARTYELRRGDDRTDLAAKSLEEANLTKLIHDAEQLGYLARGKRGAPRFETLSKAYETVALGFPEGTHSLSAGDRDLLGETYNTPLHLTDAPELAEGSLGRRPDREKIISQFRRARVAHFDDFLSPRAFDVFRRYLLESTIWHDFTHIGGFVAAYLEDGLACPLLLQIVDELRRGFPELLAEHPLTQAWAFKAVTPSAAVDVHADDAAISVNFWMTPTDANLSAGRGGMRVCKTPPPADWTIQGYEADRIRSVPFLEQNAENTLDVPYRANRAVLFESRLVHASDLPEFKKTYENHRINVSLLFGSAART